MLIKNNKQTFKDFYNPVLIPSLTRGIMVLLRKTSPFKIEKTETVTQNCLAIKLKSASNQEIEVAFVYNPNDESDKISNVRKALDHLADNGAKNQMIIGDYNTSMNFELDYVDYTGDPHKAIFYTVYKKMECILMCTGSSTPTTSATLGTYQEPLKDHALT